MTHRFIKKKKTEDYEHTERAALKQKQRPNSVKYKHFLMI